MPSWNSRGLRGSALEELINLTNERYREKKLGLIQKIPTPIKPIQIEKETRHITLAYFDQKSTVDYIGVIQGIPICFDAKECISKTFPIHNVHEHQMKFMQEFEEQGGVAFLLLHFVENDCFYYLTCRELYTFWKRAYDGGRKSFRFEELDEDFVIKGNNNMLIHYLEAINLDLEKREKEFDRKE